MSALGPNWFRLAPNGKKIIPIWGQSEPLWTEIPDCIILSLATLSVIQFFLRHWILLAAEWHWFDSSLICWDWSMPIIYFNIFHTRICQPDPPENCHLNVKKLPKKLTFFSKKLYFFFQKNCQWQFFGKKWQFLSI